jgi:HEAT repeat protein
MANDKVEKQLEALKALRGGGLTAEAEAALKKALSDRVNLVVAKAAQICGEFSATEMIPDLKKSFERMFEHGKDPQCWAKNALAKTLKDLDVHESAVFLRGIRHVQLEPVWGGSEDTAAVLRGTCAMGLVQCNDMPRDDILRCLLDSLTDRIATVRMDAARSLEQLGGREVLLLLRLKARVGDQDPRVTGEVLEALLQMEGKAALSLAAEFLEGSDEEAADEAALALGASRLPEAFLLLKEAWQKRPAGIFLRAMSVSRLDEALEFLLELVRAGRPRDAEEALHALELQKGTEEMVKRIEQAVMEQGEVKLQRIFRDRFRLE